VTAGTTAAPPPPPPASGPAAAAAVATTPASVDSPPAANGEGYETGHHGGYESAGPATMTRSSLAPRVSEQTDPAEIPAADEAPDTPAVSQKTAPESDYSNFPGIAAAAERRDVRLYHELIENVHLVAFEPGRITLRPSDQAPPNLTQRLTQRLNEWTGARWNIVIDTEAEGDLPLAEQKRAARAALLQAAEEHPLVQAVQSEFPGARITDVRPLGAEQDDDPEAAQGSEAAAGD
jgi:DNA polymerase-3 subunit gamma/tau